MADIPPTVLAALNAGTEETVTLVEWLAIDVRRLARAVAPEALGSSVAAGAVVAEAARRAPRGVDARTGGMGAAVHPPHASDMVRGWTTYSVAADRTLALPRRLERGRRFAADGHMAVRECAWDAWRPFVAAELARGLPMLSDWVRDGDANVRRCAVEGTRPRGVWTAHVEALKVDPSPAAPNCSRSASRWAARWPAGRA